MLHSLLAASYLYAALAAWRAPGFWTAAGWWTFYAPNPLLLGVPLPRGGWLLLGLLAASAVVGLATRRAAGRNLALGVSWLQIGLVMADLLLLTPGREPSLAGVASFAFGVWCTWRCAASDQLDAEIRARWQQRALEPEELGRPTARHS
jgi:hypothetical protein